MAEAGNGPSQAVVDLWPDVSGNAINGLDDAKTRPPRPVFWRYDDTTPHGPMMFYFFDHYKEEPEIAKAWEYRQRTTALETAEIAPEKSEKSQSEWTELLKKAALELGANDVGICAWQSEWAFPHRPAPKGGTAIVMAFAHEYDNLNTAPSVTTYVEIMSQYERAGSTAKRVANLIREQGHFAEAKTGPMTEDVLMIPPAIEAGLGELGKHGSMIHHRFGANFLLSMVMTDLPLENDAPNIFGADAFCLNCQVCSNACPPDAIFRKKQVVRGDTKWYVDFDKCLPYFVDNETCGICLAVCPWSRPGVGENLVRKMARRLERAAD